MASKPIQDYEPGRGLLLYFNIKIFGEKVGEESIKDATFRRGADHDITHIAKIAERLDVDYKAMFDYRTAQEIKDYVKEDLRKQGGYAYLILILSSHGDKGDLALQPENLDFW